MVTVRFGVGTKVKKQRGRRVGVISRTYPGSDPFMVIVRWLDDYSDTEERLLDLRRVGDQAANRSRGGRHHTSTSPSPGRD